MQPYFDFIDNEKRNLVFTYSKEREKTVKTCENIKAEHCKFARNSALDESTDSNYRAPNKPSFLRSQIRQGVKLITLHLDSHQVHAPRISRRFDIPTHQEKMEKEN